MLTSIFLCTSCKDVLQLHDLVPIELGLNSFRVLVTFMIICHLAEVQPQLSLFRSFFKLNELSGLRGWWFFGPRQKRKLIKKLHSSIYHRKP